MKHLADLPNREGFRFRGINHDNERGNCYVAKDSMGCHTVKGDFNWFQLAGWEDAPQVTIETGGTCPQHTNSAED
jgi:hypothetical protein